MPLTLFSLLLTFSFSSVTFAKSYTAYMGVGGEPEGKSTMFDSEVEDMGKLSKNLGGEVTISLNGGHSKTESIIAKNFKVPNQSFTEKNFENIIADYEKKINSGEIQSGDQLMLIINTHGAEKSSAKEFTHQISLAGAAIQNLDTGAGSEMISMDRLKSLAELAEKKNIKLAIMDLSCHSGNSIPLGNANTCVITSSGPNHYGYGYGSLTFPRRIFKHMKKGKSLEEVFLSARNANWDLSFPMISSPVGKEINEEMYGPITPYLYSYGVGYDKFSPYIRREAEKGEACEAPQELESLKELIQKAEDYQALAKDARFSGKEAKNLREALDDYYKFQKKMKDDLNAFDVPKMSQKENFCTDYQKESYEWKNNNIKKVLVTASSCTEYTVKEILRADFSWAISFYEKMSKEEGSFASFYKAELENAKKAVAMKEELIKKYPDLKDSENYFDDQKLLGIRTGALAAKVAYASQELYDALYRQRSQDDKRPNPCKDFIL